MKDTVEYTLLLLSHRMWMCYPIVYKEEGETWGKYSYVVLPRQDNVDIIERLDKWIKERK